MRELVVDAWRMCTPKMLHELPELPAPAAVTWSLIEQQEWGEVRPLLHPYLHFDDGPEDGGVHLRGRTQRARPPARPPDAASARDGRGARRAGLSVVAGLEKLLGRPSI